jgi:hypothetical protein
MKHVIHAITIFQKLFNQAMLTGQTAPAIRHYWQEGRLAAQPSVALKI